MQINIQIVYASVNNRIDNQSGALEGGDGGDDPLEVESPYNARSTLVNAHPTL